MNKWLLIGASSFTGTHFHQYLKDKGEVVQPASMRDASLTVLYNHVRSSDYVVNFAAANVVAPSWRYPESYFNVNVVKLTTLLDQLLAPFRQADPHSAPAPMSAERPAVADPPAK